MVIGVHHIGYIVSDIMKSQETFSHLGWEEGPVVYDPIQQCDIEFMLMGSECIELVEPKSESHIRPMQQRLKNAPYHICYEVDDIERQVADMQDGYTMVSPIVDAVAFPGKARVAFLYGPNDGLIELVELHPE